MNKSKSMELAKKVHQLRQEEGLKAKEIAKRLNIGLSRVNYLLYNYNVATSPSKQGNQQTIYVAIDTKTGDIAAKGTVNELVETLGLSKGTVSAYVSGKKQGRYAIVDPLSSNTAAPLVRLIQENPDLPVVPLVEKTFCRTAGAVFDRYATATQWARAAIGKARVSKVWEGANGIYEQEDHPSVVMQEDPKYVQLCESRPGESAEGKLTYETLPWQDCIVVELTSPTSWEPEKKPEPEQEGKGPEKPPAPIPATEGPELVACPFCKSEAKADSVNMQGVTRVRCTGCEATTPYGTLEEVVALWNRSGEG